MTLAVGRQTAKPHIISVIRSPRHHAAESRRPPDLFGRVGKAVNLCAFAEEVAGITYRLFPAQEEKGSGIARSPSRWTERDAVAE
jgi:hypothetical protein